MAILQRLGRLTVDVLSVEAGSTIETTIDVGPFVGITREEVREFQVSVGGLPASWYSISTERLRLPAGETAEVLLVIHPPHLDPVAPLGEYQFVVRLVPRAGNETIILPARLLALAPGATTMRSRLLQYLPSIFHDDLFLARFLLIFQSLLDPIGYHPNRPWGEGWLLEKSGSWVSPSGRNFPIASPGDRPWTPRPNSVTTQPVRCGGRLARGISGC